MDRIAMLTECVWMFSFAMDMVEMLTEWAGIFSFAMELAYIAMVHVVRGFPYSPY